MYRGRGRPEDGTDLLARSVHSEGMVVKSVGQVSSLAQ